MKSANFALFQPVGNKKTPENRILFSFQFAEKIISGSVNHRIKKVWPKCNKFEFNFPQGTYHFSHDQSLIYTFVRVMIVRMPSSCEFPVSLYNWRHTCLSTLDAASDLTSPVNYILSGLAANKITTTITNLTLSIQCRVRTPPVQENSRSFPTIFKHIFSTFQDHNPKSAADFHRNDKFTIIRSVAPGKINWVYFVRKSGSLHWQV